MFGTATCFLLFAALGGALRRLLRRLYCGLGCLFRAQLEAESGLQGLGTSYELQLDATTCSAR
eukprot:5207067-Alexandrium_andersonii.AAC.1